MAKLTRITLNGKDYSIDMNRLMNVELMAIERETGWTALEWQTKLNSASAIAATALVWLVLKRFDNPQLLFDEVEFDTGQIEIEFQNGIDDEGKAEGSSDTSVSESQTDTTSIESSS